MRLALISPVMLAGVVVEASRMEKAFWIPALMKTVSRVGWDLRISETRSGSVSKSVISH